MKEEEDEVCDYRSSKGKTFSAYVLYFFSENLWGVKDEN